MKEATVMFGLFKRKKLDNDPWIDGATDEANRAVTSEPELTSEKQIIQSVERFRVEMSAARSKAKGERELSIKDDKETIRRAEEFVRKTSIGNSLTSILRTMWHWGAWSLRDDWNLVEKVPSLAVHHSNDNSGNNKKLLFDYNDSSYEMALDDRGSPYPECEENIGSITLMCNSECVIQIGVTQHFNQEYDMWSYSGVESLKLGDWIQDIVELDEKVSLACAESYDESSEKMIRDRAVNLPDFD